MEVIETPRYKEEWDIRTRLTAALERLRPAEQRVARFLLDEGRHYPDLTLAELAQKAGTSQSAVVDLCKSIGLSGFREFRLLWVKEQTELKIRSQPESQLFGTLFSELTRTEQLLQGRIERAAAMLRDAKEVFLFGSGGSGLVAELCAEGLAVAGRLAFTFKSDEAISSAYFNDQTVIVVISHRGRNPRLAEAMERAREVGARSILITSRPDSLLASVADEVLLTSCPHGPNLPLITAEIRAVQMAAVHALTAEYRRQSKQRDMDLQTYRRWHDRQNG